MIPKSLGTWTRLSNDQRSRTTANTAADTAPTAATASIATATTVTTAAASSRSRSHISGFSRILLNVNTNSISNGMNPILDLV